MAKIIKGESMNLRSGYFDYYFKGQMFFVQGELYFNESKQRYEHTHYGPRGGKHLIIWKTNHEHAIS